MYKVEKMHVADIMEKANLYLSKQSLYEIWKKPTEKDKKSYRPTALELLENEDFADRLIDNEMQLYSFLLEHDAEIDKVSFVMTLLRLYKEKLSKEGKVNRDTREIQGVLNGIKAIRNLIKDIDKTFIFYNLDEITGQITHLTILNTQDEVKGINRKDKNSNAQRLEEIKKDIDFGYITEGVLPSDLQHRIAFDSQVGAEMRYAIDFNTILREFGDDLFGNRSIQELAQEIPPVKFAEETTRIIELHIEELNMDKLLLCSICKYLEAAKEGLIKQEDIPELKRRVEIARKHIKKNVTIEIETGQYYSIRDFEQDMKRFVGRTGNIRYLSTAEVQELKNAVLTGEISLTAFGKQIFEAISLDSIELSKVLQKNPNNYAFLLLHGIGEYSKTTILKDIINANKCSADLLNLLCEKKGLTSDEVCDLFEKEIISVSDLKRVREQVGKIITNERLVEKYKLYKENPNDEQAAKFQLERYALAYRNTELSGKTVEQIQEIGEELVADIGDEIEPSDLIPLYSLDVIPLKVAVDWGGENIIEELVESESLKPIDAKYLRNEGLLNEDVLERLFKKCTQMSYSYQVALVYAVFDGQTQEDQQIRENLAQYYHIESGIINSSGSKTISKKRAPRVNSENESARKVKMRDPGAKYNLLAAIDEDVKIEEGIIDGHIIFHYPNIDDGTVLIEKLHKIAFNRENGLIEIKADNESATYIMSEEEFIKMKSQLIQDGKIDRTQLTQRWWVTRDPEHWIPHVGIRGWEETLKTRFSINTDNQRYSREDIEIIEELIEKSIESKKGNER